MKKSVFSQLFRHTKLFVMVASMYFSQALGQQTMRLYLVGNSVTDGINYDGLQSLAQSRSKTHINARHMIPGSPLELLWDARNGGSGFVEAPYNFPGTAFPNYQWDAISLQPFDRLIEGSRMDVEMVNNYINLAKTNSPNVQFFLYARYPRTPNDAAPTSSSLTAATWNTIWNTTYEDDWGGNNETKDFFEKLLLRVRATSSINKQVLMVPAGHVMKALNDKMAAGQVPGYTKIWQAYQDGIHVNNVGSYILACTYYATLYKDSPVGIGVPAEYGSISNSLATIIQQTVWEVVSTHPYAGISGSASVPVANVSLQTTSTTVSVAQNFQLTATISPSNATNQNVTWSSSNTNIATVNASGVVRGVASGSATITARTADGNKTATCAVSVSSGTILVSSVAISPTSINIKVGNSSTLAASVSPANATNSNVTWTSSNTSIATVDVAGKVTALSSGTTTITLRSVEGNKSATSTISCLANSAPIAVISANPTSGTSPLTVAFSSAGSSDSDAGDFILGYEWDFADGSAIDKSASPSHTFVSAGTYVVKLKVMDNNNLFGAQVSTTIIVSAGSSSSNNLATSGTGAIWQDIPASSSTSDASKVNNTGINNSNTSTDVVFTDVNGVNNWQAAGVVWSSAQSGITSVKFYNGFTANIAQDNGIFSAGIKLQSSTNGTTWTDVSGWSIAPAYPYSLSASNQVYVFSGAALSNIRGMRVIGQLRSSSNEYGTSWALKVKEVEVLGSSSSVIVTGVSVSPSSATINVGATTNLTATVAPSNATNKTVSWSSSNTSIATVNSSGVVSGVAAGSATITATTQDGGRTASSTITVNAPSNGGPSGYTLCSTEGQTCTLNGTQDVAYGANGSFNYLYNQTGSLVCNNGTFGDPISGIAKSCYIKSAGAILVISVSVSPTSAAVNVGSTTNLTATVLPSNATNKSVTWSSSNTSIATVNSSGVVSGVAAGSATITATTQNGSKTATAVIAVSASPQPSGNLAISGTGAIWQDIPASSSTSDASKVNNTGINNSNTSTDVVLADVNAANNWQAAGVTWATAQNGITSIKFYNGFTANIAQDNGVFLANIKVQSSTNGTIWADVSGWSIAPAYPYSVSASNQIYVFSGAALNNLRGIRVVGQVRLSPNENSSWALKVKEVEVFGGGTVTNVPVTGVSLSQTSATVNVGASTSLTATVAPSNATNKNISWSSSNSSIASVNASGVVSAIAAGSATITATTQDGGRTASCSFAVSGGGGGGIAITITKAIKHQTIDGFGFFGAEDVWWSGESLISDAWADKIISDLGVSIWRNELYPPADQYTGQDADWAKQRPVVVGINNKAKQYNVPLKHIFTVWSPPSSMKCAFNNDIVRQPGQPHTSGTKWGGALDPTKYSQFANWLKSGIQNYANEGIDIYAISPQNEPYFVQGFNSCFYKPDWFVEMINGVIPAVKQAYPNVKIYGAENMLDMEGKDINIPWFYQTAIKNNTSANNLVDIVAVHGYSDGVAASSGSNLNTYWDNLKNEFVQPYNKRAWMTETSGYGENWENITESNGTLKPGALSLAQDIYSGLKHGNMSGWVWWQGSGQHDSPTDQISTFTLMDRLRTDRKYAVSKHFYRYIRPDAKRVEATTADSDLLVTAYEHTANNTNTVVIINNGSSNKTVNISGLNLPSSFTIYRSSNLENCLNVGTYSTGSSLVLPAKSLVTLQAGGTPLRNARMENSSEEELVSENSLSIYPNPTNDVINVNTGHIEGGQILISDIEGKVLIHTNSTTQMNTISVAHLATGVYVVTIKTPNGSAHKKLFVE